MRLTVVVVGVIETTDVKGIPVVVEQLPFFRSVAFGIWIFAGSRDEPDKKSGLFHFLEHLVFKGTKKRTTNQIAVEIDRLGGRIDAFTSREITCYSAHVVSEHVENAFELISDLMLNPQFPEDEIERERQVILEEIRSIADNPTELIHERLYSAKWLGHPLGRSIAGNSSTVLSINRDDLLRIRDDFYKLPRIIITAGGDINLKKMSLLVERYFDLPKGLTVKRARMDIKSRGVLEVVDKQLEQAHLLFATNGLEIDDSRRHQLSILNLILGGGVSSRLFQTIREQRGLAYTIYSFYDQYSEGGMFGVYAACAVSALRELWGVSRSEILRLIEDGPTEKEVERAKLQSSGNIKMSMESPNTRISQIAYQLHYFGEIITEEVMIDNVMSVTADQVRQLGRALWTEEKHYTKVALGPLCEKEVSFLS